MMRKSHGKMWRAVVSGVLAFSLAASMTVPAFAASSIDADGGDTEREDPIVYVSIGDSMTNGYGLDGYDGSSGIVNYAMGTYGNQFAAWLAGYEGDIADDQVVFDGSNGVVDHRQLAMSGCRAEDLNWVLNLDYQDDALMQTLYNKWGANWQNEVKDLWFGEWGFKVGDYRSWSDFVDYTYRYADGAARILATYGDSDGKGYGYFTSSYANEAVVDAAQEGLGKADLIRNEDGTYFPRSKSEVESIGG